MKLFWTAYTLSVMLLALVANAQEMELRDPPTGYFWEKCPEIKAAFLRPEGWHFKRHKQGDTLGYFITKEEIVDGKRFTTGVTINVLRDVPQTKGMTPWNFAQAFREAARESHPFIEEWNRDMGPFKSLGFIYSEADKDGGFTVHNLVIANEKTGTAYLILFEAPVGEFKAAWKIAEPVLKLLFIDDTI